MLKQVWLQEKRFIEDYIVYRVVKGGDWKKAVSPIINKRKLNSCNGDAYFFIKIYLSNLYKSRYFSQIKEFLTEDQISEIRDLSV